MRIVHEMALAKEQIRKTNLCRLYKSVTFWSENIHNDQTSYDPDLRKPKVQLLSNVTERFSIIEVPTNYWPLWETVLKAIKTANAISIRELRPLLVESNSEWLITSDCRYVYKK